MVTIRDERPHTSLSLVPLAPPVPLASLAFRDLCVDRCRLVSPGVSLLPGGVFSRLRGRVRHHRHQAAAQRRAAALRANRRGVSLLQLRAQLPGVGVRRQGGGRDQGEEEARGQLQRDEL